MGEGGHVAGKVCPDSISETRGGSSFYVQWGFTSSKVGVHIRHIITKGVGGMPPPGKKLIFGKNRVHFL